MAPPMTVGGKHANVFGINSRIEICTDSSRLANLMYVCVCVCVYVHVHVHVCLCVYVYVHVCVSVCVCMCMCMKCVCVFENQSLHRSF